MRFRTRQNGSKQQLGGVMSQISLTAKKIKINQIKKPRIHGGPIKKRKFVGKMSELKNYFKTEKKLFLAKVIAGELLTYKIIALEDFAANLSKKLSNNKDDYPMSSIILIVKEMQRYGFIEVK